MLSSCPVADQAKVIRQARADTNRNADPVKKFDSTEISTIPTPLFWI